MAAGILQSKESLLYAGNAKSSRASNKQPKSRCWRHGVKGAVRYELMYGQAADGINRQTAFGFEERELKMKVMTPLVPCSNEQWEMSA
jgi:hypothetical protein